MIDNADFLRLSDSTGRHHPRPSLRLEHLLLKKGG